MNNAKQILNRIDGGLIIATLLTLFAVQALRQPGLPTSADMAIHIHRTMEFERAWAPGVIFPRWAPNLAYGYGYPLFVFAPPLPYIIALGFQQIGLNIELAFKLLISLIFLLYAVGMYLFGRSLFSSVAAGLVAATAYAFAPFALREALLVGGNIPQLLAIGLFPWPLWAITQAIRHQSWGWTILAGLFYAALMLSHLFHVLIFTPVFGVYIVVITLVNQVILSQTPISNSPIPQSPTPQTPISQTPNFPTPQSLIPFFSLPLGLLLSAFFWLPAFTERYDTRAQVDIYLAKSPFFIRYPHWAELTAWIYPLDFRAANPYIPLTLGSVTLGLAGLGLLTGLIITGCLITRRTKQLDKRRKTDAETTDPDSSIRPPSFILRHFRHLPSLTHYSIHSIKTPITILFFGLVATGGIFMSLPASQAVWEMAEILQVAEFPWRMLGLTNLGLAVLAGAAILLFPPSLRRWLAGPIISIQLVAIAPFLFPPLPFTQHNSLTLADQLNYERSSQSIGTTTLGEYLPQNVTLPPTTSPMVNTFLAGGVPARLDYSSLPDNTTATLQQQTAVTHRYQIDSPTAFTLRMNHFNYPGWQANIDGQPTPITPEDKTGLILINMPAGQHSLTIYFGETPARVVALALSGLAILGLVLVVGYRGYVGKSEQLAVNSDASLAIGHSSFVILLVVIIIAALWLIPFLKPLFTFNSPRGEVLAAQHPVEINFANGIQLIGYDLSRQTVAAGDYLQVVLYWQTEGAPHRVNLQPFVHLDRLDTLSTVAETTNYTPGDITTESVLPTFHWDNQRYIRDEHDLIIPVDIEPWAYALRVGLIDPDQQGQLVPLANGSLTVDQADTAQLGIINITPSTGQEATLQQSLNVQFSQADEAITLTGFEVLNLTPTELTFTLAWQSDRTLQHNYTVFSQLLDTNRNLVASFDTPPLAGAYPTTTWLPEQTILDPRHLPLDGVLPGEYTLVVGLYQPETGQRLTTASGPDFIELSTLTIP